MGTFSSSNAGPVLQVEDEGRLLMLLGSFWWKDLGGVCCNSLEVRQADESSYGLAGNVRVENVVKGKAS